MQPSLTHAHTHTHTHAYRVTHAVACRSSLEYKCIVRVKDAKVLEWQPGYNRTIKVCTPGSQDHGQAVPQAPGPLHAVVLPLCVLCV